MLLESLPLARFLREPVMRHRQGNLAGDSLREKDVVAREMGLFEGKEIYRSSQATTEPHWDCQNRLHSRLGSRASRKKWMRGDVIDNLRVPRFGEVIRLQDRRLKVPG